MFIIKVSQDNGEKRGSGKHVFGLSEHENLVLNDCVEKAVGATRLIGRISGFTCPLLEREKVGTILLILYYPLPIIQGTVKHTIAVHYCTVSIILTQFK